MSSALPSTEEGLLSMAAPFLPSQRFNPHTRVQAGLGLLNQVSPFI